MNLRPPCAGVGSNCTSIGTCEVRVSAIESTPILFCTGISEKRFSFRLLVRFARNTFDAMAKRTGNSNATLNSAKSAKNDEFYTQLPDIENELRHYASQLKGKTVFCNCDDPAESNFFLYFALNFKKLKLKHIITTHYIPAGQSYKIEVGDADMATRIAETIQHGYDFNSEVNRIALQALDVIIPLQENGDFRSQECIDLLKQSDIVITNPPFSLFREYVIQLMECGKQFLIIGDQNAITYKEIFRFIKDSKAWLGIDNGGTKWFQVPLHYNIQTQTRIKFENGVKFFSKGSIVWFTNLDHTKRHEELRLYKTYNATAYPKYDNYDAIEVSKVAEIPVDYDGVMGVPITFLDKYNPEQFEIVGNGGCYAPDGYSLIGALYIGGKKVFKRIFIRKL